MPEAFGVAARLSAWQGLQLCWARAAGHHFQGWARQTGAASCAGRPHRTCRQHRRGSSMLMPWHQLLPAAFAGVHASGQHRPGLQAGSCLVSVCLLLSLQSK